MGRYWSISAVILLASTSAVWGADAGGSGSGAPAGTAEAVPDNAREQEQLSEIESAYTAAKYDAAIEAASTFLRSAKDADLKAQAARIVADSLRKKKDWKRACSAYIMLRDRFKKGSEAYVRYHAMADILRASPTGVYGQAVTAHGEPNPNPGRTLDDDTAVSEAMGRLAAARAEKLKVHIRLIKGARTAQEVIERFAPVTAELRQLRVLWPEMPSDLEREAAQAASMRMARIGAQIVAGLKSKQAVFEAAKESNRLTISLRKEMLRCQGTCNDMAKAEASLAAGMDLLAGTAGWPEGQQLKADCVTRRETYETLAKAFEPPELSGRGGGGRGGKWSDPSRIDRGGGMF